METPLIVNAPPDDPRLLRFVWQAADGFAHDFERVKRDLDSGASTGMLVEVQGIAVGGFVLGIDDGFLVIEAAAGSADFDLVQNIMPRIEECADEVNARGVRIETRRRGMVEKLGRMGFETHYVTMAKVL